MIDFIKNMNALTKAEIVFVLVSTFFYWGTLYQTANFKSAALASCIAVVLAGSFIPSYAVLVSAISAAVAIAIAILIALASASITRGAILAKSPIPIPTPSPLAIAVSAALIAALFAGIAVYFTVKRTDEIGITKKRAVVSPLIEIMAILAAFYIISHTML